MTEPAFSTEPCGVCGWRHQLDAFKPGQRVRTLVRKDRGLQTIAAGATGEVVEWSQYGGPIHVRVQFSPTCLMDCRYRSRRDDRCHVHGRRENYTPCELEHV